MYTSSSPGRELGEAYSERKASKKLLHHLNLLNLPDLLVNAATALCSSYSLADIGIVKVFYLSVKNPPSIAEGLCGNREKGD